MAEPQIRYCQAADGVNIAYCVLGEGAPFVYASNVWGDLYWYTHDELVRRQIDAIAASGRRVVRHDVRGTGSSDRDAADLSIEARVLDLEAVVDQLSLERFPLCGYGQGGPTAVTYCVRHLERVSHLILVNSFASGSAWYERIPAMRMAAGLSTMAPDQWEFFTLSLASAVKGFGDATRARRTAEGFRSAMTPAVYLSFAEETRKIDVLDALPAVSTPTLVIVETSSFASVDLARPLATRIPGARFVTSDDYTADAVAFLGDVPRTEGIPASASGTAVILFADIVDSTGLTERMGDAAFRERARALDASLRAIITEAGGAVIDAKTLGDGVLATFPAASQAIDAALRCASAGDEQSLPLHLGLHAGDVIREQNNVFGGVVNIASRISGLSAPGEVLVSDVVRALARTSASVTFEDRGEHALKGVGEAQRVYAVRKGGG